MKRVLIFTDLEGTAGISSFPNHAALDAKYLDRFRRLATAEVNAAIEGLVAVGVEDILVVDGHGPEGLWYEDLIEPAKFLHGRPLVPWKMLDSLLDEYEACAIIGQHAMAGVRSSNMNHTQDPYGIDHIKLNGKPIGEIAQFALYRGAKGMPLFFLSGEEDACREAESLISGVQTVAVKKGLGGGSAISLTITEARRRIRQGMEQAVHLHRNQPVKPLVWPGPYVLEKRFFHTIDADTLANQIGAERVDGQTVRFRGENIREVIYR
ncbi:MAG: M55 family metallopeptidase [Phycisphaerales bacterium]|jgi:D-amino peptidase|nr:M55 family metallopeptidase [Phycisphaerales bacterium]